MTEDELDKKILERFGSRIALAGLVLAVGSFALGALIF